jgi:hypothetical protein
VSETTPLDERIRAAALVEYEAIKAEQRARIGFRDNLLYATIASYAAFFGFAASDEVMPLLFVPFVGIVLGWTYLVNDEKVSRLGQYVRLVLAARALLSLRGEFSGDEAESPATRVFSWELYHRNDPWRVARKWGQCMVDLVAFVLPGIVAVCIVWHESEKLSWPILAIMACEAILLLALLAAFVRFNDTRRSKQLPEQSSK